MHSDPDDYDIFISYAHVDNEPLPGADQGWVRTFVAGLKTYLGRAFGQHDSARIWMDYEQLRGNHAVTPAIHGKLATVKLLIPLLSPGYLASRWCMQELETFLALHSADSGRIFPIRLGPSRASPSPCASCSATTSGSRTTRAAHACSAIRPRTRPATPRTTTNCAH